MSIIPGQFTSPDQDLISLAGEFVWIHDLSIDSYKAKNMLHLVYISISSLIQKWTTELEKKDKKLSQLATSFLPYLRKSIELLS